MSDTTPLQLDPIWLNAAEKAARQYDYGDLIPLAWIRSELEIDPLEEGTYEQFKELQFRTLTLMDQFRDHLLIHHCKALLNVRGQGYRIINPGQQTATAMSLLHQAIVRHLHATRKLLTAINFTRLSDDQIRENVDARNKVAAIQAFNHPPLRLDLYRAPLAHEKYCSPLFRRSWAIKYCR